MLVHALEASLKASGRARAIEGEVWLIYGKSALIGKIAPFWFFLSCHGL